jgi:hypothetical protein
MVAGGVGGGGGFTGVVVLVRELGMKLLGPMRMPMSTAVIAKKMGQI